MFPSSQYLCAFPSGIIKRRVESLVSQGLMELQEEKSILSAVADQMEEKLKKERDKRIALQDLLEEYRVSTEYVKQRLRQTIIEVEELKKANQWLMDRMKGDHFGVNRAPDPAEEVRENWRDYEDSDGSRFNSRWTHNQDEGGAEGAAASGRQASLCPKGEGMNHSWE